MEAESFQEPESQSTHQCAHVLNRGDVCPFVWNRNLASNLAWHQDAEDIPDEMSSGHRGSHPMGHATKCRHPGGDRRAAYVSPAKANTVAMAWPCAEDVRPPTPEAWAEMPSTREADKTRWNTAEVNWRSQQRPGWATQLARCCEGPSRLASLHTLPSICILYPVLTHLDPAQCSWWTRCIKEEEVCVYVCVCVCVCVCIHTTLCGSGVHVEVTAVSWSVIVYNWSSVLWLLLCGRSCVYNECLYTDCVLILGR